MTWVWSAWLLALIACFAILGAKALVTTLSRYNWHAFQAWPPIAVDRARARVKAYRNRGVRVAASAGGHHPA